MAAGSAKMQGVSVTGLILFMALLVLPIIVGHRVGIRRGHEVAGLVLGLGFSWLGVAATMLLSPKPVATVTCPHCGQPVPIAAPQRHPERAGDDPSHGTV